jgi:hypothetical protein
MSLTVYWSMLRKEWMRAKEPQRVLKNFYEKKLHSDLPKENYHKCPFVYEYLKNTYSLHSLYDYSFFVKDNAVSSTMFDQNFFDNNVLIRSVEKKLFSFSQPFVFFTEEKSLKMSAPEFPYLENNNITQRCIPIVGQFDIGKYFRTIDFPFFLRPQYEEFRIEEGEIFGYVNFDTEKKINFKQFYPTNKIISYVESSTSLSKNKKTRFLNPETFYNNFKIKNQVIKEIKLNLI